jgi:4-hydroxy-2-oxoheptanedioate aldolase
MMIDEIRRFKDKIARGPVYGPFSKTKDPGIIEAAGFAGFDFVILDLEHGPNTVETLQNLVRAAQIAGILPIVRVKEGVASVIGEVLDIGAAGIQAPQVTTAEEAAQVIHHARFAPAGMRGVCRFVRSADYSAMDRFEYFKTANEAIVIVQLEGQEAIRNLDSILAVQGIDVVFIGPYDLSQSLGVSGQIDHPAVEQKMKEIIAQCAAKNSHVGTFVDNLANAGKWKAAGAKYISYSVDLGLFYEYCKTLVEKLRGET